MRRAISALMAAMAIACTGLVVSACGSDEETTSTASNEPFQAEPRAGIAGALLPEERRLWRYDRATGKYEVVEGDATSYEVNIERPTGPLTIAYQDPWGTNSFAIPVREGFQDLARRLGIRTIYCDADNRPDKAVECASTLSRQRPDFAFAGNWQAGAAKAQMAYWDRARIPAMSEAVPQPNAILFGADSYAAGNMGGRAAGEFAKREWGCRDVYVFLGESRAEGVSIHERIVGFSDGVQQVCGKLPDDHIQSQVLDQGTAAQAIDVTNQWLTANPQARRIVAVSLDDERASGIAKSFASNDVDGRAVGLGCDTVGVAVVKEAPGAENKYLGCVSFFIERFPEYLMSIALDVLAGRPVPEQVNVRNEFLTHETIDTYYP